MKTIVEKDSKLSKYVFEDAAVVTVMADKVQTPSFIISDMNASNSELVAGVTPPEDWTGDKYFWKNNAWELNPDWVDPATMEEEELTAPPEA